MDTYNFIVDASSFEKGLGNIKRWCEDGPSNVNLRLYIPTYTLRELDFQRYKCKSFMARESLKYIEHIEDRQALRNGKTDASNLEIIIEIPDILDLVMWSEVLEIAGPKYEDQLNKLPKRLKNLLKSCVYQCHLNNIDVHKWILISENQQVRELAKICKITIISLVDADSELSRNMNNRAFKMSKNFNNKISKKGVEVENNQGKKVIKTSFRDTVYANRGTGTLWTP